MQPPLAICLECWDSAWRSCMAEGADQRQRREEVTSVSPKQGRAFFRVPRVQGHRKPSQVTCTPCRGAQMLIWSRFQLEWGAGNIGVATEGKWLSGAEDFLSSGPQS